MAKYRVYLETVLSVTVNVEVPDDLDESDAREAAIEKAFDEAPGSLCAHCTGWGSSWSRDVGELELSREPDGTEIKPERVES